MPGKRGGKTSRVNKSGGKLLRAKLIITGEKIYFLTIKGGPKKFFGTGKRGKRGWGKKRGGY